jgi:glutamate formiminotransferase
VALVECIPNISEGRRPDVIAACGDAIRRAGAALLDVHSDVSHNRSVFTFAGPPEAVRLAALALIDVALDRIDLRHHSGVHPRLGAVDVVPMVPIADFAMVAAVALARDVAERAAARHGLPVYLYEEAATRPDRRRLEDLRRGQFEGLAARMADPAWAPDYGPSHPHPSAGASVIGARPPLIAYNVNLATTDLSVAKRIARTVRESSGGLPAVKALGLALADRGVVQVSMNLTDFRRTSVREAFHLVRQQAEHLGVAVLDSELVGLVPAAAWDVAWPADLQMTTFDPAQILEQRLAAFNLAT